MFRRVLDEALAALLAFLARLPAGLGALLLSALVLLLCVSTSEQPSQTEAAQDAQGSPARRRSGESGEQRIELCGVHQEGSMVRRRE
jgi:hypothetical protein